MSSNWSMSEDVQMCISYCRQSTDPISGNKQKIARLWEKVHADFEANWVQGSDEVMTPEPRSQAAIISRFAKLKPILMFWGSCISYARRNPESGGNLQDELRKAQTRYYAQKKKTFIHFECWEQVKMHQTFAPTQPVPPPTYTHEGSPVIEEVCGSEIPTNPSYEEPLFSTPESNPGSSYSPVRPQGVKAAKEARRKGKKVAISSINYNDSLKIIAENQTKQLAIQQTQIELAQKQMAHTHKMQEQAESARKLTEETRIMEMNTDIMTPKSKKYFSKRKAAILRRYGEEEEDVQDEEENNFGNFSNCYRPQRDD